MQRGRIAPIIAMNTLNKLVPNKWWTYSGTDKETIYAFLKMHNDNTSDKPTWEEFEAEYNEQEALYAMELIREERDKLLNKTDWMTNSDVHMSEEWKAYRQALRDVPNNNTPAFDENEDIIGVTWPTKPSE